MNDSSSTSILDSLTSGILAVDLDSRVLFVSAALCLRLGIDRDSWLGKPASGLFCPKNPRISAKRSALYRLDPRRDGARSEYREIEWSDGTRIVHLREDTAIKGSVDLILGGCVGEVSPEALELLEVAHSACDRMIRLINNILDLSKIEAGQIQLRLELIDLAVVVERSLRGMKALAAQAEITLKSSFSSGLPVVEADRDRMEQVITNLVSNAIKFSPAKGEIEINLSAENEWVRCSVSDHGSGIAEGDLVRIFGKFQQAGLPRRGAGTGLGLAVTHALVTEHKGKIWVESRIGEGSCFVFCLPVASRRER